MLNVRATGAIQQSVETEHSKFVASIKKWIFSAFLTEFWQSSVRHIGKDISVVTLMTSVPATWVVGTDIYKEVRMT